MTFESIYNDFEIYLKNKYKYQTYITIIYDLKNKVFPYFKDKDFTTLSEIDILKWKDYIKSFNYKNKYNDRIYNAFCTLFDYCCTYYNIENNCVRKVGRIKHKIEIKHTDFYTLKEFNLFIKNLDNIVYRSYFILMFYCGTRPGEAMALQFSDYDGNYIHISKSIHRKGNREFDSPKNVFSIRKIVCNNQVKKCIKELKKYYTTKYGYFDSNFFIFGGNKPIAPSSIDRYKRDACNKAKLKVITQHQFRHSYATFLISNGIPLNVVASLLGHSNIETTSRVYVHNDENQEKRVLRALNSQFFRF